MIPCFCYPEIVPRKKKEPEKETKKPRKKRAPVPRVAKAEAEPQARYLGLDEQQADFVDELKRNLYNVSAAKEALKIPHWKYVSWFRNAYFMDALAEARQFKSDVLEGDVVAEYRLNKRWGALALLYLEDRKDKREEAKRGAPAALMDAEVIFDDGETDPPSAERLEASLPPKLSAQKPGKKQDFANP